MIKSLSTSIPNIWVNSDTAIQNYTNITANDISNSNTNFYAKMLKSQIDTIVPTGQSGQSGPTAVKNPYSSLETYTLAELIYNNINFDDTKLPTNAVKFQPVFGETTIDLSGSANLTAFKIEDKNNNDIKFDIKANGDTTINGNTTMNGVTSIDANGNTNALTITQSGTSVTDDKYISLLNNTGTEVFSISVNNSGERAQITTNGPLVMKGSGSNIKIEDNNSNTKFEVDGLGNTTIDGTLDVSGSTTFSGSATFNGSLTITGNNLIIPATTYVNSNTTPSARIATQGDVETATLGLTMKEPVKVIFDFKNKSREELFGTQLSNTNKFSSFRLEDISDTDINSSFGNYIIRTVTDSSGTVFNINLSAYNENNSLPDRTYLQATAGFFILGIRNTLIREILSNTSVTNDANLKNYLPTGTRILLKTDNHYFDGIWIVTYVSDTTPDNEIERERTWLVRAYDYDDIGSDPSQDQNSYTFVEEGPNQGGYVLNIKNKRNGLFLSTVSINTSDGNGLPGNNGNTFLSYESSINSNMDFIEVKQFSGFGEIDIISTQISSKENITVSPIISNGKREYTIDLDLDSSGFNSSNTNIEVLKDILKSYDQTFRILFDNLEIPNFSYSNIYDYTYTSNTITSNTYNI